MSDYAEVQTIFKVLSDTTRLQIIDMLSCKEMCACDILDGLEINQSTLSHHMRVLTGSNMVLSRKKATWIYYSINRQFISKIHEMIDDLVEHKDECKYCKTSSNCNNQGGLFK